MKYRYLVIGEDGEVSGTNSEDDAKAACDFEVVVDMKEGTYLGSGEKIGVFEAEGDEDEDESDD